MPSSLAALFVLLPTCALVPGFVALRRANLPDELRLSVSVALSLAFLYVVSFALFLLGAGAWSYFAVVGGIFIAGYLVRRELRDFLRSPGVGTVLLNYSVFTSCLVLLSLLIRSFSGAAWSGDWLEHFERTLFFLGGLPLDFRFIGMWSLTARPPLYNAVAAFFLKVTGAGDFAAFQLVAVFLASLQFLGAAALAQVLARSAGGRRTANLLVLAALLCLNPSVIQNGTYTWTRALTSYFILLAAALYLLAIRDGSPVLRRWCYLHLGLALVTHYSTVPYLLALAPIELWFLATRRLSIRDAVLGVPLVAAPLAPWLAFALDRFGVSGTFLSNSTAIGSAPLGLAENVVRALGNLFNTFVPHTFRDVPPLFAQEYLPGYARDYAFLIYQTSFPAMLGSVGGLSVAWLLATSAIRKARSGQLEIPILVALFLSTTVILGIAVVAEDDPFGLGHVCLQPLAVAGLVWLSTTWGGAAVWLRAALGVGLIADATFGIGLHFWMQHLTIEDLLAMNPDRPLVSAGLVGNLASKYQGGLVFLGDLPGRFALLAGATVALAALIVQSARRAPSDLCQPHDAACGSARER